MSRKDANKRWRKKYPQKWRECKNGNYARGATCCWNSGNPWTDAADFKITARVRPRDRVLAAELGRSVKAIQRRRAKVIARRKKSEEGLQ